MKSTRFLLVAATLPLFLASCKKDSTAVEIAVFVPGILADSPIYEMMADGAEAAVGEYNASLDRGGTEASLVISEAGTNQGAWGALITALAASGKYDLILSSGPSLPDLIEPIVEQFPKQKFILLDAFMTGCPTVAAARFNQREQAYLAGFAAALSSKTGKVGLIAAQEYPVMNNVILPSYREGAIAGKQDATVDFRIVGNWTDAAKGALLAEAMKDSGVDVILPIAAGASEGVISVARENGLRLVWFDNEDFSRAPKLIVACAALEQEKLAKEMTEAFLLNGIEWGATRTLGVSDGYVRIVLSQDREIAGDEMLERLNEEAYRLISGELKLPQN